jgi:FAD/FMN-containing dehydrogenase
MTSHRVRPASIHETGQGRIRAGAGVALEALQKLLHAEGRWYAPVPTRARSRLEARGGVIFDAP